MKNNLEQTTGTVENTSVAMRTYRQLFAPTRWTIICWALLLLWSSLAVVGNLPWEPDPSQFEIPDIDRAISYEQVVVIGWPFTYQEISATPNKPPTSTIHLGLLVINVMTNLFVLFCLIFSTQVLIPRFSIRTMMIGMVGCAIILLTSQLVFKSENYYLVFGFMLGLFFLPVALSIIIVFTKLVARRERIALPSGRTSHH